MSAAPTSQSSAGFTSWLPAHDVTAWDDVNVRSNSRFKGSTVLGQLQKGKTYTASEQRAGDYVTVQNGSKNYQNYYWVLVQLNNQQSGWVSAVYLEGGDDNYPLPQVQPVIPDQSEYT